eukprot:gene25331-219_t
MAVVLWLQAVIAAFVTLSSVVLVGAVESINCPSVSHELRGTLLCHGCETFVGEIFRKAVKSS